MDVDVDVDVEENGGSRWVSSRAPKLVQSFDLKPRNHIVSIFAACIVGLG